MMRKRPGLQRFQERLTAKSSVNARHHFLGLLHCLLACRTARTDEIQVRELMRVAPGTVSRTSGTNTSFEGEVQRWLVDACG